MICGQCGAPLPRADVRFCTRCGAPTGAGAAGPSGGQPPPGQPPHPEPLYAPPPYGPPPAPEPPRSPALGPIVAVAAVILVVLAGIAYWALTQMDDPPIAIGRAGTPTPTPAPTPTPTPTRAPGIGINIPGAQGTPTTITIPIPGIGATPGLPRLPIPGVGDGSPGLPTITLPTLAIPGASGTQPPNAKLTADQARQKVRDSLASCRLLQGQIELSQVTFEPPAWVVRLPLSGATWRVNDETGEVTPDERAAERIRNCRL